jgi:hypothetical protein
VLLHLAQRFISVQMLAAGDEPDFSLLKIDEWHVSSYNVLAIVFEISSFP